MDIQELSSKKGLKGFAYYRVSTNIQKSIPTQQTVCREFADRWGLIIIEEFQEIGSAHRNRPVFNEMMNRLNEVNFVMAWSLDRLIRKIEDIVWFFSKLKETNTEFINSLRDPIKDADLVQMDKNFVTDFLNLFNFG